MLKQRYRYDLRMHVEVLRACAVLTQLAINDGELFLLVVITITIIIVDDKSKDVHLVVRTAMGKMMTVSTCNILIRTSVVSSCAGGSIGSSGSMTMNTGLSLGCGVGLFSLISGS